MFLGSFDLWQTNGLMWATRAKPVVLLLLLVLLLFFVHAPAGGFQATHGPNTTLKEGAAQSYVEALMVFFAGVCAALLAITFIRFHFVLLPAPWLRPAPEAGTVAMLC